MCFSACSKASGGDASRLATADTPSCLQSLEEFMWLNSQPFELLEPFMGETTFCLFRSSWTWLRNTRKLVAQIVSLQQGVCVIVKSSNADRIAENNAVRDWKLSEEALERFSEIKPQIIVPATVVQQQQQPLQISRGALGRRLLIN